jgi:sugar/nucleoside kinase (ribokinase family)
MSKPELDVYVYGMTVLSTIHLLKGDYPEVDTYQEIEQTFIIPGGEAANCAVVLRNLGVRVALDACYLGDLTKTGIQDYCKKRDIDCSKMAYLPGFPGWRDLVLCDGKSRTVFGWFGQYLFGEERLWTIPSEELIQQAKCVALDPFFGAESELVAELCVKHQTDYVTIDCHWNSEIAQQARVLVCSKEFIKREYVAWDYAALLAKYRSVCKGLVIFTFGGDEVLYISPAYESRTFKPYSIEVVDTLGAGDTFRAGVVFAVLQGMSDDDVVRFASACAAVACTRFPSVYEPPTLEEIEALMASYP